jgi:uncharacterized protein YjdB
MRVGDQAKLTATAVDAAGRPVGGLGSAVWSTSNAAVASMMGNGNVRAARAGTAFVTATMGGRSGSVSVVVTAK